MNLDVKVDVFPYNSLLLAEEDQVGLQLIKDEGIRIFTDADIDVDVDVDVNANINAEERGSEMCMSASYGANFKPQLGVLK